MSEWLFRKELKPRAKEKELFYRESGQLQFHPQLFKVGKLINDQQLLKEDVLAITLAFQLNEEQVKPVIRWFRNVLTIQGHDDGDYQEYSKNLLRHDSSYASSMTDLVRFADTSIENITTTQIDGKTEVVTSHVYYNAEGKPDGKIEMLLNENESDGTQKLFNLSGYLFDALDVGCLLIIDEMDAKLHPNLMEKIITMFQDPAINNKRAQLIFTTHNTNILDAKLLRRDQLWITEKDRIGASSLYSIADYNTGKGKARNTEALEQNYIQGKYGGVPFLGELENFLDKQRHEQTSPAKH